MHAKQRSQLRLTPAVLQPESQQAQNESNQRIFMAFCSGWALPNEFEGCKLSAGDSPFLYRGVREVIQTIPTDALEISNLPEVAQRTMLFLTPGHNAFIYIQMK